MLEFYAPWCGHCQRLTPEYVKAAKHVGGLVKLGAVDCDDSSNQQLCSRFGIQGFPTLKVLPVTATSATSAASAATDYQGGRTAAAIAKHMLAQLPLSAVTKLTSENGEKWWAGESDKVVLVSAKPTVTNLAKALAVRYTGRVAFAQIDMNKEPEQAGALGIDNKDDAPAVFYIDREGGANADALQYDGKINFEALSAFIDEHAPPLERSASSSSSKKPSKPVKKTPPQDELWRLTDAATTKERCLSRPGLCAIALLDSSAAEHDAYVAVLQKTLDGVKAGRSVTVTWLDALEHRAFVDHFGYGPFTSADLPRLLVVNGERGVFHKMLGAFDADKMQAYFKQVSSGKMRGLTKVPKDVDLAAAMDEGKGGDKSEL